MKKLLVFAVVIMAALMMVQSYTYEVSAVLQDSGYAVVDNEIEQNLQMEHDKVMKKEIEAVKVNATDFLYTRGKSYYLGENKQKLNTAYPLFVNSTTTLLNLTGSSVLLNRAFEPIDTYNGLYISDGTTFNSDRQQADGDEFIVMKLANGLSVTAQPMEVVTNMGQTTVAMNSVIRFEDREIRYYTLEDNTFVYGAVQGVNEQTMLTIGYNSYSYKEFMDQLRNVGRPISPPDVVLPSSEPESSSPTVDIPLQPSDGQVVTDDGQGSSTESTPSIPVPKVWTKPILKVEEWNMGETTAETKLIVSDPSQVLQLVSMELYPIESKTLLEKRQFDGFEDSENAPAQRDILFSDLTNNRSYVVMGVSTYLDNNGQSVTERFYIATIITRTRYWGGDGNHMGNGDGSGSGNRPGGERYVKPVVTCEPFIPGIYQIASPMVTIYDPSERITRTGVSFEVLMNGDTYRRRSVRMDGPVTIGPLPPNTKFVIRGTFSYLNENNVTVTEMFYGSHSVPIEITTLNNDTLPVMQMQFANGSIYSDRVELANLHFIDNPNDPVMEEVPNPDDPGNPILTPTGKFHKYGEATIPYVSRVNMLVSRMNSNSVTKEFVLPGGDMVKMKNGDTLATFISTAKQLISNNNYDVMLTVYDVFGNKLPLITDPLVLKTRTAKQLPTAELILGENAVASSVLVISAQDDDYAVDDNTNIMLQVIGSDGYPLPIEIDKTTTLLDEKNRYNMGIRKNVVGKKIAVNITNLPANQIFTAQIITSIDLNDSMGIVADTVIGKTQFATASLADLGSLHLRTDTIMVSDSSAKLKMNIESNTNKLLSQLLSEIKIELQRSKASGAPAVILTLRGTELESFLNGTHPICTLGYSFNGLVSFSEYTMKVTAMATQGGVPNNIATTNTLASLFTLRAQPTISYNTNIYVSGNTIEFFNLKIVDSDNAISAGDVILEGYDTDVDSTRIAFPMRSYKTNTIYPRVTFERLTINHRYRFDFLGSKYSQAFEPQNYSTYHFPSISQTTTDNIAGTIVTHGVNYYRIGGGKTLLGQQLFNIDAAGNEDNRLISSVNGTTISSTGNMVTDYIPVIPGASYISLNANNNVYAMYDKDKKFVKNGHQSVVGSVNYGKFTIPTDTDVAYIRKNVKMDSKASHIIKLDPDIDMDFNRDMVASLELNITDIKRYMLESSSFILRVYSADGVNLPEDYQFTNPVTTSYPLTKEELATAPNPITVRRNITLEVKKDATYKIELVAPVFGSDIVLGSSQFTTGGSIIPIYNAQDMVNIQRNLSARYIVMEDIVWSGNVNFSALLSEQFMGELDFNGHKITRNLTDNEARGTMFYAIGASGVFKNAVIDYSHNRTPSASTANYFSAIALNNYGTISNIILNINSIADSGNTLQGGLVQNNRIGAVVENFVINITGDTSVTGDSSGAVYNNYGTVRNGYITGKPFPSTIASIKGTPSAGNDIGGLVRTNYADGIVENVYSTVDLNATSASTGIGLLVKDNAGGIVRNGYSTGDLYALNPQTGERVARTDRLIAPAIADSPPRTVGDIYYFTNYDYIPNALQKRLPKQTLQDPQFHNQLLGDSFQVDELVSMGYYPQLKLPACMPAQPRTKLPAIAADQQLVITDVQSQGIVQDNTGVAIFSIRNPAAVTIKSITVEDLTTEILEQTYAGGFSRVKVRLSQPQKFISQYKVTEFQYSIGEGMNNGTVTCVTPTYLYMAFYREMSKPSQWKELKSYPDDNFRIVADLDMQSVPDADHYIFGTFKGTLDGGIYDSQGNLTGMHTVSNLRNALYQRSIFHEVSGTIKNMRINSMKLLNAPGDSSGVGFIYNLANGKVDNLHFFDSQIATCSRAGTVAINTINSTIINTSATRTTITVVDRSGLPSAATYFGGLAGSVYRSIISNCYVSDLKLDATQISRYNVEGAIGGLIGRGSDSSTIENCYATGNIDTMVGFAGGLIGIKSGAVLRSCWSAVDITTGSGNCAGIASKGSFTEDYPQTNLLAVGNVYSRQSGAVTLGRIVPNGMAIDANAVLYASETQVVEATPESLANDTVTKLLTLAQLRQPDSYYKLVGLSSAFDCSDVINGNLPLLRRADGNGLLPFQQDIPLPGVGDISIKNIVVSNIINDPTNPGVDLYFEIQHPKGVKVDSVEVEAMTLVADKPPTTIGDTTTVLQYRATPTKYWDTYRVLSLKCNGGALSVPVVGKKVEAIFYKEIKNATQWNELINPDSYENYRIMGDIDFKGLATDKIKKNVSVNRLDGYGGGSGKPVIKNLTLSLGTNGPGLINVASSSVTNLTFDNINIAVTGGNSAAIIGDSGVLVKGIDFKNITIESGGVNRAGCIGTVSGAVENIILKNIVINGTGALYGGLSGRANTSSTVYLRNITADNISVTTTGNNVGGLVGELGTINNQTMPLSDARVTNVTVKGTLGVGGIVGVGNVTGVTLSGVTIVANNKVGGISGSTSKLQHCYVAPYADGNASTITAISSYVGGIAGQQHNNIDRCMVVATVPVLTPDKTTNPITFTIKTPPVYMKSGVTNLNVKGQSKVGGIVGGKSGGGQYGCSVYNSTITGDTEIGGIAGLDETSSNTLTYDNFNLVRGSTITGRQNVGGAIGLGAPRYVSVLDCTIKGIGADVRNIGGATGQSAQSMEATTVVVNVKVDAATGDNVGGVIGVMVGQSGKRNITQMTAQNVVVNGNNNVGGIVGSATAPTIELYALNVLDCTITAKGSNAGGIAGEMIASGSSNNLIMYDSYVLANVTAGDYAGGVIGYCNIQPSETGNRQTLVMAKVSVNGKVGKP